MTITECIDLFFKIFKKCDFGDLVLMVAKKEEVQKFVREIENEGFDKKKGKK